MNPLEWLATLARWLRAWRASTAGAEVSAGEDQVQAAARNVERIRRAREGGRVGRRNRNR